MLSRILLTGIKTGHIILPSGYVATMRRQRKLPRIHFLKHTGHWEVFKEKAVFQHGCTESFITLLVSYVRIKKKEILSLEDFPADATDFIGTCTSEEEAESEYRRSLINFAFQKIGEEDRSLITLHYYEEMSTEEISEVTGISKSNIKVKLFRARQKMLQIFENAEKNRTIPYEYTSGI